MLITALPFGGTLPGGVSAQQQQQQTPNPSRQRQQRTVDSPRTTQPQTTEQQTSQDDDPTLQDDGDVVRVETDLTNILFTAVDKQKRFVTTLKQEDIRVTEDGQPQEVFAFYRQTDLPLSLAIVIDTSASEERTLPIEKEAASAFVDAVLRPNKDEAAVVSFTGEATLELGLTGSVSRVRRAISRVEFVPPAGYIGGGQVAGGTPPISGTNQTLAGSTAIWDAIWVTSDEVLTQTSDKTRRAIILLTDGIDSSSQKKMQQAIDRAIKADAVIYSIGIGDEYVSGIDESSLKKVSERTGGRAFFPRSEEDLRAAFAQIQEELRSQYLVAYSPTNKKRDGSYRQVQIEVVNQQIRKNLRLTYRQGYFAKAAAARG
ncbi:MAG TPA: VWA domain-containing protein [Pyrinomonadaceae bacterium]